jgi:hypothetical protein
MGCEDHSTMVTLTQLDAFVLMYTYVFLADQGSTLGILGL